ncbi:MAG: recombinase family protein [Ruminococcaceae bacterium]|nr:recombinase family protein [Oscillospiraceae bacterium]
MADRARHAALYVRVSTDAQREEGYSIDAQSEMLVAYCVSRGIRQYELYVDGGFSGSHIDRPEMTRLIADIRLRKISHVVVYKLDRLSRSQKDTLYLIEDVLLPNGVSFVSLNENMDTATPIGRAMLGIMSAFAQLERETIRERTRMGMKERVKSGLWPGGGKIPFGYDYDASRGILVPNRDADTVRLMYELYLRGWSMMAIARYTGLKYERLAEQILRRKTNAGYIVYNGETYRGQHEAIVSEETYEATMRKMAERARGNLGQAKCLLAGLIYCGVCGAKMRYQKWGKAGYKIYCYSQDKGKPHLSHGGPCRNGKMWADELEQTVIEDLFSMSSKRLENESEDEHRGDARELFEKQMDRLSRKLKNLYHLYGDSGDQALTETIEDTKRDLEAVKERLLAYEAENQSSQARQVALTELNNAEKAWDYMTQAEKQNVLRSMIERIVVTYDRVEVYYKLLTDAGKDAIMEP